MTEDRYKTLEEFDAAIEKAFGEVWKDEPTEDGYYWIFDRGTLSTVFVQNHHWDDNEFWFVAHFVGGPRKCSSRPKWKWMGPLPMPVPPKEKK